MINYDKVARSKPAPKEVDHICQRAPPRRGAKEKTHNNRRRRDQPADARGVKRGDLKDCEECQDIGDHHNEVGQRKAKDRGEILPRSLLARVVAAHLHRGILQEDVGADDNHQDTAPDAQDHVVLLDLAAQHRVEDIGEQRKEGVGRSHTQPRDDPRAATLAQRALNA